jgi:hypothetical protein
MSREFFPQLKAHFKFTHLPCYRIDLLKKRRSQWGLKSARGQAHTITSIGPAIERVRARFPKQGSHDMKLTLMHEEKMSVSRYAVFFGRVSAL